LVGRLFVYVVSSGIPMVTHPVQFSVLARRPASTMAALCREHSVGLLCYGALAGGFLGERFRGAAEPAPPLENRSLVKYKLIIDEFGGWETFQEMLACLARIGERHDVSAGTVALRWVLDQAGVSAVIVGARHSRHLEAAVRTFAFALDDEERAEIARVQSGSSGPSGDVYGLERVKGGKHAAVMRYSLNRE
jgi:aryl-alcohol dehydrogenase-like predicted oxidoreductase